MFKYKDYFVEIKVGIYQDNKGLYVGLNYYDDELECLLPFSNITVNTDIKVGYLEAPIDVNNLGEEILTFLESNSLAEKTDKRIRSGFCKYPVYKFSESRLLELCPLEFSRYIKTWSRK